MRRWTRMVGLFTLLAGFALFVGSVVAQGSKPPTVKEVMARLHKGASAPLLELKRDLQADVPRWDVLQKNSQEFVAGGMALTRNDPPRGDKASWARLSKQYLDTVTAMNDAVQKQNKAGALAAHSALIGSCNTCHDAHRSK